MTDIAEKAEQQEELYRQAALALRKPSGPEFTGRCRNCNEELEPPKRWCDLDCREDWSRREER